VGWRTPIVTSGRPPAPRWGHTLTPVEGSDHFVLFGGHGVAATAGIASAAGAVGDAATADLADLHVLTLVSATPAIQAAAAAAMRLPVLPPALADCPFAAAWSTPRLSLGPGVPLTAPVVLPPPCRRHAAFSLPIVTAGASAGGVVAVPPRVSPRFFVFGGYDGDKYLR